MFFHNLGKHYHVIWCFMFDQNGVYYTLNTKTSILATGTHLQPANVLNLGNEELTLLSSDVNLLVEQWCSNMLMWSRLA